MEAKRLHRLKDNCIRAELLAFEYSLDQTLPAELRVKYRKLSKSLQKLELNDLKAVEDVCRLFYDLRVSVVGNLSSG